MSIHQQKSFRFAFNMSRGMHRHLKIICAEDEVAMTDFVTKAIEQEFAAREERAGKEEVDQSASISERKIIPKRVLA